MIKLLEKKNLKFENYTLSLVDNGLKIVVLKCDDQVIRKDVIFNGRTPKAVKLFKVLTLGERNRIIMTNKDYCYPTAEYRKEDFAGMVAEAREFGYNYVSKVKTYRNSLKYLESTLTERELQTFKETGTLPEAPRKENIVCERLPNYKITIGDDDFIEYQSLALHSALK